jgi:hypothetical protein
MNTVANKTVCSTKAHYALEMQQFLFLKNFLSLVSYHTLLVSKSFAIYINHLLLFLLCFQNSNGIFSELVHVFYMEVKILLCLHFATFMTHYCMFSTTFFSCWISNTLLKSIIETLLNTYLVGLCISQNDWYDIWYFVILQIM